MNFQNISPLLLITAAACLCVCYAVYEYLRQNRLLRVVLAELRRVKEREKQFSIRLDDSCSKVNNLLTQINKQASLIDQKVAALEEKFSSGTGTVLQFEDTEKEEELESRLRQLEQIAGKLQVDEQVVATEDNKVSSLLADSLEQDPFPLYERQSLSSFFRNQREKLHAELLSLCKKTSQQASLFYSEFEKLLNTYGLKYCLSSTLRAECDRLLLKAARADKDYQIDVKDLLGALYRSSLEAFKIPSIKAPAGDPNAVKFPQPLLVIGLQGVGKTHAVLGLWHYLRSLGKSALLADCVKEGQSNNQDTLARLVRSQPIPLLSTGKYGKVKKTAYRAIHQAQDEGYDYVIFDTTTALDSKGRLSDDLRTLIAMVQREQPGSPQELLYVLDASRGEEALLGADSLKSLEADIQLIVTHLDSTTPPGLILTYSHELTLPVSYLNLDSSSKNLCKFDVQQFLNGLLCSPEEVQSEPEQVLPQEIINPSLS